MDKELRKRRAAVGALALLRWRNQMAGGDADRERARAKYELMIAAMRREAEVAELRRRWRSVLVREDLPAVSRASHCS